MIISLGFGSLLIAFVIAIYGIVTAALGARRSSAGGSASGAAYIESARLAMLICGPLVTLALVCLALLLAAGAFQVEYVYSVTSRSMPLYLKLTALWGGQAGSLLFWSFLLAVFSSIVALRNWQRDREFLPWVIIVMLTTLAFFLGLSLFAQNPFVRYWYNAGGDFTALFQPAGALALTPPDGAGLNPLLRHPGMVFHPPALYIGFVAFVIPFAFAIAALVTGRSDDRWMRITRRWTLAAWLFLSLGLLLGMRWAYDVLGWGGYWGWDPVEVAALMPWLTGTAYLHSVVIQEKRGLFKRWNIVLIVLTYALVIFGTFLTRSGVLSSVHAFSASSIGPAFFVFIGVTFLVSLGLLLKRWPDLRGEDQMTSLLSREALFLVNNLLFVGILAVCFWGVIYPLISELITNQKVTVGPPFYKESAGPLFAGLLLLLCICPLSAWGHSTAKTLGRGLWKPLLISLLAPILSLVWGVTSVWALVGLWLAGLVASVIVYEYVRAAFNRRARSGENLLRSFWALAARNRRRYGGMIIHLGIAMMALGVIGIELFQTQTQGTIPQGGSLSLSGYTLTYNSLADFDTADGHNVARAVVAVSQNGRSLGELYPRREYYYDSDQPMTVPGVRSTMADDLYVVLVDWQPISSQGATFKVYHNPLVNWLWLGGLVFVLGAIVAALPQKE
jgi:cytochrome c-type biogenesis protein CcmF